MWGALVRTGNDLHWCLFNLVTFVRQAFLCKFECCPGYNILSDQSGSLSCPVQVWRATMIEQRNITVRTMPRQTVSRQQMPRVLSKRVPATQSVYRCAKEHVLQ